MAETQNQEILHDFSPILIQYKDGRIERLYPLHIVPPSLDSDTAILSKDIIIDPDTNLSVRLYLPKSAKAQVVVVSVDYRLAPEHPVPIAHEDSWRAFQWAVSNEEIARYADLSPVFVGGDSAGGNIAHYIGMRQGVEKMGNFNLIGMVLNCPFFNGEEALKDEEGHETYPKKLLDAIWRFACPSTVGCDDPLINPLKDPKLGEMGCKKVLLCVAEKDVLWWRGRHYKEALEKSGWDGEIEIVDVGGEGGHVFSVMNPTSENSIAMFAKVASFING